MTHLDKSELLVGIQPLYLRAKFSTDSNTTPSGSDGDVSTWLPAGGLYYVHNLMPKLKIRVSAVGYFGLGLEYENDWVGRYYAQEIKRINSSHRSHPKKVQDFFRPTLKKRYGSGNLNP
jgi:long-chain fatty acid transport protein